MNYTLVGILSVTRELRLMGWKVTLIAAGLYGHQDIQGVEVLCIPRPEVYFLRQVVFNIRILYFLIKSLSTIDIILFHTISAPWMLLLHLLPSRKGKLPPLLVMDIRTVHMMSRDREALKDRIRRLYYQFSQLLANQFADGQTAITRPMASLVQIPQEKLWGIWPSGVDLGEFELAQVVRKWPLPEDPIRLVYIGALHYERNLMTLCQAIEKANAEGIAFMLSLIGDGTEREDLEEFATRTSGRIRVLQPVPHAMIWKLLAQAHVGVLPFPNEPKFQVCSPIKLFEYMASGLPILATSITCHTDVVGNGNFAIWAENADLDGLFSALHKVQDLRSSLNEMGRLANIAAQEWTWQKSAIKLKAALEYGLSSHT